MENLPITTNIHPLRLPLPLPDLKVSARLVATCIDQHAVSLIWLGQFFHAIQTLEGAAALRRFVAVELRGSRGFSPANLDRYLTLGRHGLTLQDGEGSHFGLRLLKEAALFNDVRRQDLLAYGRGEERHSCLALERLCQASRQASDPKEGRKILLHGLHGGAEPLRRVITAAQRVDRVARSMKLLRQSVAEALANGARADAGQLALLELVVDAAVSEMREWLGSAAPASEPEAPPQALPQPAPEVPTVASPLTGPPNSVSPTHKIRVYRSGSQAERDAAAAAERGGARAVAMDDASVPPALRRSCRSSAEPRDAAAAEDSAPPALRRSCRSSAALCAVEAVDLSREVKTHVVDLTSEVKTPGVELARAAQAPAADLLRAAQAPAAHLTSEAQAPAADAPAADAPVAAEVPLVRVPPGPSPAPGAPPRGGRDPAGLGALPDVGAWRPRPPLP